jgi:hypothetical protein
MADCWGRNLIGLGKKSCSLDLPVINSFSVPNIYDEYPGYPHWFWAYPSEHLAEPVAEYNKNLKRGFEFVLSLKGASNL